MTTNGHKKQDVPIDELETPEASGQRVWTEELNVAADELVENVKRLVREANVRRIIVRSREGKILLEIPLLVGLGGIALLPMYGALAIAAALATEHSIVVERVEKA